MHCPSCGFDKQEGMRFCGKCGTSLAKAALQERCRASCDGVPGTNRSRTPGQPRTLAGPGPVRREAVSVRIGRPLLCSPNTSYMDAAARFEQAVGSL